MHRRTTSLRRLALGLGVFGTALGIVGLTSFSVRQRTKQIGTRRALGARRIDIVRYFMTENWLITSIGVSLGAVLAVALNYWLVNLYSIPPISWYYIPVGILCLMGVRPAGGAGTGAQGGGHSSRHCHPQRLMTG